MAKIKYTTEDERRKANREKAARWLAKPGNLEKHRTAVRRCRKRPHAREAHRKRQLSYASRRREQEKTRAAKWRKENPKKAVASHRKYYVKNSETIKEAMRQKRRVALLQRIQ